MFDTTESTPVSPEERPGFPAYSEETNDLPEDRDNKIALFRDMCDLSADDIDSIEQTRAVQNDWEAIDPAGAREFFRIRLEQNPDSALHNYLFGRLVKSQKDAVFHARRTIELAPDWVYGYRLLMNIYGLCLFRLECRHEVQQQLLQELEQDAALFERVLEGTPDHGALLGYVFDYYLYTQQPKQARAVIKKARKMRQDWALENDAPMLVKANEGKLSAVRRYAAEVVHWRISQGQLSSRQRELAIMEYLVFLYRRGFAFENALNVMDEWKSSVPEEYLPGVYFDRARFLALLGRVDEAFESLREAIRLGFDNLDRAELHPCLLRLRADPRWEQIRKKLSRNYLAGYEKRKTEALAGKMDTPAPEFELPDEFDNIVRLPDLAGRIVILEFWSSGCQPCRTGIPELSEFTRHDAGRKVRVYMVNVANENRQQARKFIDIRRYKAHLLFGDDRTKKLFKLAMIPATLVLDPNGHIRFREDGVKLGIRERLNWWVDDLKKEFEGQ